MVSEETHSDLKTKLLYFKTRQLKEKPHEFLPLKEIKRKNWFSPFYSCIVTVEQLYIYP